MFTRTPGVRDCAVSINLIVLTRSNSCIFERNYSLSPGSDNPFSNPTNCSFVGEFSAQVDCKSTKPEQRRSASSFVFSFWFSSCFQLGTAITILYFATPSRFVQISQIVLVYILSPQRALSLSRLGNGVYVYISAFAVYSQKIMLHSLYKYRPLSDNSGWGLWSNI